MIIYLSGQGGVFNQSYEKLRGRFKENAELRNELYNLLSK